MSIPRRHYWGGCSTHQSHFTWASFGAEGGISSGPFQAANVSYDVGDSTFAVEWNRERILEELGANALLSAKQVHGTDIFILDQPMDKSLQVPEYDALITNQAGIALMIQQADCQAVLLADPCRNIIAAAHVGWRGNVDKLIEKVVQRMENEFLCKPESIQAYISPSLGPCCAEFIHYKSEFPKEFQQDMHRENFFNLWQTSKRQLQKAGVKRIECAEICTCCSDNFFSYRRAKKAGNPQTGRNCSLITMETIR